MFDLRFTPQKNRQAGRLTARGVIQIGDFEETFVASLSDWTPEHYLRQWRAAAQRLVAGEARSAFITSFAPPERAAYFVWWPCYRVEHTLFVQNQMKFYEQVPAPFLVDKLDGYIDDRKTVSESEGLPISEWEMPLEWVRDFLVRTATN